MITAGAHPPTLSSRAHPPTLSSRAHPSTLSSRAHPPTLSSRAHPPTHPLLARPLMPATYTRRHASQRVAPTRTVPRAHRRARHARPPPPAPLARRPARAPRASEHRARALPSSARVRVTGDRADPRNIQGPAHCPTLPRLSLNRVHGGHIRQRRPLQQYVQGRAQIKGGGAGRGARAEARAGGAGELQSHPSRTCA